jgi:hypothetical protein
MKGKQMNNRRSSRFVACGWFFLVAVLFCISIFSSADAQDVKGLLNQVNKELRQAQRDMFSGKNEKAIASLEGIEGLLLQIKEADPNNPRLKSSVGKYKKLVKDLERKTGKDLGGGTLTSAASSSKTELPPKPKVKEMPEKTAEEPSQGTASKAPEKETGSQSSKTETSSAPSPSTEKLPYQARRPISNAKRNLDRIDGYIEKLKDPSFNADQLVKNMEAVLEGARKDFEEGKAKAAEKGVTSHPDFDGIEAGIADAEDKIEKAKAGHAEAKSQRAARQQEVMADVKALKDEYDKVRDVFDLATGNVFHYNDLKTVKEALAKIESFESDNLKDITAKMDAFAAKYGSTRQEIDEKAESMGYSGNYRASFAYTELGQGIENIKKTRTVMADDLIRRTKDMKGNAKKGSSDFNRLELHTVIKEWAQTATAYDAENPRVKEFNAGLDAWIEQDTKEMNAKIDKATFPVQAGDAPGDAKRLAKVAKEFLQKEEDKNAAQGKTHGKILSVAVTGPWRIFKKNLLAEPIQYNLPVAVAVQIENEKSMNLVRVYLMTMLTQEMKGVKKAPPYIGATVGNSYYVRPSALK